MTQPIPQPGQYPPPAEPARASGEARPSIGALFASVTNQISGIIRGEIELNKVKLRTFAAKSGKGVALLVAAAVFALYLLGWALHTAEIALALVLPAWAASLIIVGVLLLIVLILALVGARSLKSAQAHRPDPAASVAATKEAIEKGLGK